MNEKKSLPPLTLLRVEWDQLQVGDIVCVGARLERLEDNTQLYANTGPGVWLVFGSRHAEVEYELRNTFGELNHYVRLARSGEPGYIEIPEERLGFV